MGVNSLFAGKKKDPGAVLPEVRIRVGARVKDRAMADEILMECGSITLNGPAGGGGRVENVKNVINVMSILVPREDVKISVTYLEV